MKRAKVKWAACFLAAVMVVAILPLSVFAADEPAVLIVGGVNALETSSGEGWSYQKETSTLTLNGYNGGPIHADGLSLNVVLAENSVNTITSEVSQNRSALGSNEFSYSDNHIIIRGEGDGSASLKINGDLQGIYAQGNVAVQNCVLTVDIVSTEASEKEVSNGTNPIYPFIGVRAGGGLLLEDATLNVTALRGTKNQKIHVGVAAATGEAEIVNCTLNIDAASVAVQSNNEPLRLENCVLDISGGDTAAVMNQFSTIDLIGCTGSIVSDSVGVTSQRADGKITLQDCELSVEAGQYGIMALANDFYMESSQLDFPSAVSYGIYAVNQAEIVKGSVVNGQNCTFACRIPAASGCTVDDTSAVHGIQIFNNNQNVTAMGSVSLDTDYADTLGRNLDGRAFTVALGAELTVQEGAVFDISSAASTDIQGDFINYGTFKLDGATVQNTGVITNWSIVEETEGTALQNDGEIYSICTAVFAVKGNDITLMHAEQPGVIENMVPATCTKAGSQDFVVYCGDCKSELSRDEQILSKTGHDWDEPVWEWSDDGKSCTVTFTCKKDNSHTETPEVTITSEVKTPPTCTEDGVTIYTAMVEFAGEIYTSTEDITDIPAAGHNKTETVNAKEATCTVEGNTGDKVCKVCGEIVEAGKTIAKTAHTYESGKCTVCGTVAPDYKPETEPEQPTNPETKPEDKPTTDVPQTGDNSNMIVWVASMLMAGAGMAGTIIYSRKRKHSR